MKNIIIVAGFLLFANLDLHAQTCNATGAQINSSLQVVKNIKTDFGASNAKGNGVDNDHAAFEAAAAFINSTNGNVKLIIPDGIYLIGKQIAHLNNNGTDADPVFEGVPALYLLNVSNVTIQGEKYTKIIYKDSMRFGTFDTILGNPPPLINLYNPSDTLVSINPGSNHKYAGTIGNFLHIEGGNNIEVKNIEINGNNDRYFLGGNWGLGGRPIELRDCYGIFLSNVLNSTLRDLVIHHFGVDNLYIRSDFTGGTNPNPTSKNLILDRVVCEYSGRSGFSWVGGENICVTNSTFNHASNKIINTSPGYGMDIEPEGIKWEVLCRDGFFNNSVFGYNRGLSLVAGTSLDNPLPSGTNGGYGYSYDHYFSKCLLIGTLNSTTHNYINRVTFDSCKFYGQVLNYGSSISLNQSPSVYKNSYFSDCYNGRQVFQLPLLSMELSYRAQFINNVYKRFFSNGMDSWIFHYGTSFYDCDSSFYKPLFQNNIFYFYPAPTGSLQYASNSRRSLFVNNNFYKYNTDLIRWGVSMGCQQGEEGNEEPNGTGTGVIQNYITASPQCADTVVCERDIYTSNDIEGSEFYQASSFIYTDSKITLDSTEKVKYQSAESINMNPGFDSDLSGSSYIDLYIAPCTLPSGRTTNEAAPKPKMSDLEQINKDSYLIVYPNPSENEFVVQFKTDNNSRIEYWITDIQGRVIERKYIEVQQVPSSSFSIKAIIIPGVYLLTLNFGHKKEVRKLVRL